MSNVFHDFLAGQPILLLFLVLSLGYLIGNIKAFGINLGAVGGVLLAGLFFGHFGFTIPATAQTFGFVLFIFCVGLQAGPRFFDVLMTSGLKYLSLALVVALTGFGLTVTLARVLDFAPGLAAGLMGGAMTTTPTLAAAQDAVNSGLFKAPAGLTNEQVLTNIGAGYALTYLFGLIGLIIIIRVLPKILHIDLPTEAAKLQSGDDPDAGPDLSRIARRTYRITKPELLGRSTFELERATSREVAIVAIRRNGVDCTIGYDTRLELGDEVLVIGRIDHLLRHAPDMGVEIAYAEGLSENLCTVKVVVANREVVGKPMADIRLDERIGALPIEIKRQRKSMPVSDDLILHRGDVMTVYGPDTAIDRLVHNFGYVERDGRFEWRRRGRRDTRRRA